VNKRNIAFFLFLALSLINSEAFAANTGGDFAVTQWLQGLLTEVSGPLVYTLIGIAGVIALAGLAFAPGELNYVFRILIVLVLIAFLAMTWVDRVGDATGVGATIPSNGTNGLVYYDRGNTNP
jgi:type IV secretory pathway VirB2 component (pilin)